MTTHVVLANARRSAYSGESISAPHQGLLSLAAVLREGTFHRVDGGVSVDVVDDQLLAVDAPMRPIGGFLDGRTPDVVGIQVLTSSLKNGLRMVEVVRRRHPDALTVLGGVGATPLATELVGSGAVDVVVPGEGEHAFSSLVAHFADNGGDGLTRVPGLVLRDAEGKVVVTPSAGQVPVLDALPEPARDAVDMYHYQRVSRGRSGNLITSRGCSYACSYCYSRHQWGVGQRRHGVERVVSEIRTLVDVYGFDRVRIEDDDFVEDRAWLEELCTTLVDSGLADRFEWEAKARPDLIDAELARQLRAAGCFRLLVGVETLDRDLLRQVGRPVKVEVTEAAIRTLRDAGIGVQATMILGIPGETDTAMRRTITWLQARLGDNPHDIVSPCFFVPFHTGVAEAMRSHLTYTIEVDDTDCFTGHIPVTSSPACSYDELWALYDDMSPDRRGQYPKIAHLAQLGVVRDRLGLDGADHDDLAGTTAAPLVPQVS